MVSKPLRVLTFLFSAFVVLAFTAGVTHAAGKFLTARAAGSVAYPAPLGTQDPSPTVEPSMTAEPSMTPEPSSTPESTPESQSKVEFSGVITAIDLEWWTIGDYVVQVTGDTEIEGDPVVGDMVSVEAALQPDGSYIAHEISMYTASMEEDDSHDGPYMTGTPEYDDDMYDDQNEHSGSPEMHSGDHEEDDHHDGNGSGSNEDDHEQDHGGSHDHGEGGDD